jgi:hypothetical protein
MEDALCQGGELGYTTPTPTIMRLCLCVGVLVDELHNSGLIRYEEKVRAGGIIQAVVARGR